jgi:hypothetical protein
LHWNLYARPAATATKFTTDNNTNITTTVTTVAATLTTATSIVELSAILLFLEWPNWIA